MASPAWRGLAIRRRATDREATCPAASFVVCRGTWIREKWRRALGAAPPPRAQREPIGQDAGAGPIGAHRAGDSDRPAGALSRRHVQFGIRDSGFGDIRREGGGIRSKSTTLFPMDM